MQHEVRPGDRHFPGRKSGTHMLRTKIPGSAFEKPVVSMLQQRIFKACLVKFFNASGRRQQQAQVCGDGWPETQPPPAFALFFFFERVPVLPQLFEHLCPGRLWNIEPKRSLKAHPLLHAWNVAADDLCGLWQFKQGPKEVVTARVIGGLKTLRLALLLVRGALGGQSEDQDREHLCEPKARAVRLHDTDY